LALESAKIEISTIILEAVLRELNAQGKECKTKAQNLAKRLRNYGNAHYHARHNLAKQASFYRDRSAFDFIRQALPCYLMSQYFAHSY